MKTGKNKYYKQSHIPERKFRELLRFFDINGEFETFFTLKTCIPPLLC
jgi:hypothetical protein